MTVETTVEKNAPHILTATVNGQPWEKKFEDIDQATAVLRSMFETRKLPETGEPVSDIGLKICGQVLVPLPNGGWPGPREKGTEAE